MKNVDKHTENGRSDKVERLKTGSRIALLSTILLFFLALMKIVVGYRFNSQLLIVDAFHSGADILINFTSLLGLWLAARIKSTRFPYGLYKAETVACLLIGALILLVGVGIFKEGYHKLFHSGYPEIFPVFPVGAALVSSVTACYLAIKQRAVGREIGSQALMTTSRDAFYDIFTSLIVLVGILLSHYRIPYVEGSVIIVISIFIFKLGLQAIGTSLLILLDANMDVDLQTEIEEKINQMYGVKGVGEVKIRRSGPFKMVECVIETRPTLPLYEAHEMANRAEELLFKDYDTIESVFIHIEPGRDKTVSAIFPVKNIDGLSSRLHGHFGRAPYFLIVTLNGSQVDIDDFYLNEHLEEKEHIGLKVIKTIIKSKIDLLFTCRIGEISFYMLKNNFIDIYKADEGMTIDEIIRSYRLKQLSPITGPTHSIDTSQFVMLAKKGAR